MAALTGTDREMLIDTCGTGGDASGTFNVSTATAFVVAGAGLRVAKHGNRSVSSAVRLGRRGGDARRQPRADARPRSARCVDEVGIGFLYAPLLHTAMKHVMAARREMGIRTVFNMLGPLTNPAGANAQVIGVYAAALTEPLARVLAELGHPARVRGARRRRPRRDLEHRREPHRPRCARATVRTFTVRPGGLRAAARLDPRPPGRRPRAERRRSSARCWPARPGPRRDIVLMNAAAALVVGRTARATSRTAWRWPPQSIDGGAARGKLEALVALSQQLGRRKNKTAPTGADGRGRVCDGCWAWPA